MTWTEPHTWHTADLVGEAAALNADLRDNMNLTEAGVATTSGQIFYATGPNVITPLAIGSNGNLLVSSGTLPSWGTTAALSGLLGSATTGFNLDSGADPNVGSFRTAGKPRVTFVAPGSGIVVVTARYLVSSPVYGVLTQLGIIDVAAADAIASGQVPGNTADTLLDAGAAILPGSVRMIANANGTKVWAAYFAVITQAVDAAAGSGQYAPLMPGSSYTFCLSGRIPNAHVGADYVYLQGNSPEFDVWAAPTGLSLS